MPFSIRVTIPMTFDSQVLPRSSWQIQRRLRYLRRKTAVRVSRAVVRLRESELALIGIAALVGLVVGAGVSVITSAVGVLHYILFGIPLDGHLSAGLETLSIVAFAAPAVGGLLVGLFSVAVRLFRTREIVDAIEANALYGGRMSLWDSVTLGWLTIVAVGFGGSAGLEAAYTQAGSGLASKVGQNIRLRRKDLRLLVGCGSAAAIAAAFNSPLAGAFYAFELVIGSYAIPSLAPVAAAALCGNLAIKAISYPKPLFVSPSAISLQSHDYILFLVLGLGAAGVSIATMRAVTLVEGGLRRQKAPSWLKPMLGGAAVGGIALFYPQVLGSGHGAISAHLQEGFGLQALLTLLAAKLLASALTVGSGMRGGLFSSSLLIGAIFGAAAAEALAVVAPNLGVDHGAYALVGMAAVAAGIVGGPLTMTLLVLETTGNFSLTTGVVVGVIASTVVVRHSFGYSFATWRFHVRGMQIKGAHDIGWITDLTVGKLMRRDYHLVKAHETLTQLRLRFPLGGPKYAFITNDDGVYIGTIETIEAHAAKYDATADVTQAQSLIHDAPNYLTPDDHIQTAIANFTKTSSEVLAIVSDRKAGRVLGYVSEAYLLRRYGQELEKHRVDEANGGIFSPAA